MSRNVKGREFTKRELLMSISIVAVMLLIGLSISNKISDYYIDESEIYNTAIQIDNTDLFKHGMDTNVGNAFVYGDLEAINTVTYPEIDGEYIYIKKIEERYERHEREVEKKDSKGNKYIETEIYYSWDHQKTEYKYAEEIKFCNVVMSYKKINLPSPEYVDTIEGDRTYSYKSGEYVKVRYQYYGILTKYTGTIFTDLRDGTLSDGSRFYNNMTIEDTLERLNSFAELVIFIFWAGWITITILAVLGFCSLDNEWLEG